MHSPDDGAVSSMLRMLSAIPKMTKGFLQNCATELACHLIRETDVCVCDAFTVYVAQIAQAS